MYSGRYKNRYVGRPHRKDYKGKRGTSGKQMGAGSGRHLVPDLRSPAIPRFERMLDRVGIPVQRFRQFRSEERVNVTPTSGRCHWYGVPEFMDYGNSMDLVDHESNATNKLLKWIMKQTPNSCDLFDIYRNLGAGVYRDGSTDYGHDSRADLSVTVGHKPAVEWLFQPYGQQETSGTSGVALYKQVPSSYRINKPGLDYTMRTHITYDNVSSLDAFVEVYCMEYTAPRAVHGSESGYNIGQAYGLQALCETNTMDRMPLHFQYDGNHPGIEFLPLSTTVSGLMKRYQSPTFAGCMLRTYGDVCRYQRTPAYTGRLDAADQVATTVDMAPAAEDSAINGLGTGSVTNPTLVQQILCNPKTDPLRVTPPTRPPSQLGFRMRKIQGVQRVRPGDHCVFKIPTTGTRFWSYKDSPVGARDQLSQVTFTSAGHGEVTRARIYYFRVWGDMIHAKVDRSDGFETDWQTGSTSMTFHTQRVCWARLRTRYNTTINPTLLQFEGEDVSLANQEMINPETGAPQGVVIMGDDA